MQDCVLSTALCTCALLISTFLATAWGALIRRWSMRWGRWAWRALRRALLVVSWPVSLAIVVRPALVMLIVVSPGGWRSLPLLMASTFIGCGFCHECGSALYSLLLGLSLLVSLVSAILWGRIVVSCRRLWVVVLLFPWYLVIRHLRNWRYNLISWRLSSRCLLRCHWVIQIPQKSLQSVCGSLNAVSATLRECNVTRTLHVSDQIIHQRLSGNTNILQGHLLLLLSNISTSLLIVILLLHLLLLNNSASITSSGLHLLKHLLEIQSLISRVAYLLLVLGGSIGSHDTLNGLLRGLGDDLRRRQWWSEELSSTELLLRRFIG